MSILLPFVTALFITFTLIPVAIKLFRLNNILDAPEDRKIHTISTPSMGGVPIFIGVILSLLIWMPVTFLAEYRFLIVGLFVIFLVGLRDDFVALNANKKIVGQLGASLIVIFFFDLRFKSLYGLFGIFDIPFWMSVTLTLFTIVVITNAMNLIDGIDGLAGSLGVFILSVFGYWLYSIDFVDITYILSAFIGATLGFLYFNWHPSKIFMGDTGSLTLGFLISCIMIFFVDKNFALHPSHPYKFTAPIAPSVAVLIIPLFDTLSVFITRAIERRHPLSPDKNHIHHKLLRLGLNHAQATSMLVSVNILFVAITVAMKDSSEIWVLSTIISLAVIFGLILQILVIQQRGKNKSFKHTNWESSIDIFKSA